MKVGDSAPDFELADQYGNEFKLSDHIGKNIMLVFYPREETPVCTKQLCSYNDNLEEFEANGMFVVAISTDSKKSLASFSKKYNFDFPLLSDSAKSVSKKYDALSLLGISKRKIVIINKDGKIVFQKSVLPVTYLKPEKLLSDEILKLLK